LFQKLSAAISELISLRRFCAPGTSKKPPQVREFVGGGGDLSGNRVEHGWEDTEGGRRNPEGKLARVRLEVAVKALVEKRQRAAAVQDASRVRESPANALRFGLRQPSAAID
jgi:hypothetical protein